MDNSKLKKRSLSQEDLFNLSELFKLMKPRVMSLVIFTCAVGLLTAPNLVSTKDAIIGILLVSLGAGAAGALNMWYESDLDALMTRTCLRPIPTGKVNKNQALIFGVTLSIVSVLALDYFTNRISAAILLLTILFYVFIYTIWLKRRTPQNIVIGGAAGAFPPVIGWTIATGSLSIEPLAFFLIIFFWTPSHFWALSLYKSDDYKKANIPMLPLTNGIESTKINIFVYSLLMLPVIIFPYLIFIVLSSVFVAILNANNKFALASGLPIILNISIVTSILLFPYFEYSKIIFLSWSVIIGGMMQTVFLFLSIEKSFWKSFFAFKRYYTSSKQFFILIWPVFFASTFMQINVLIGMLIASFEPGAVSYLYFAERIYYIPLTLIAIAISTVLIPNLSNTVRKTSRLDANVMQLQAYKYCVFTVIPATFVLIGISDELIKLLFERGEFTAEDSMQASLALKIFLIGLPAATFSKILTPYFYAIEQPKIILKVAFYTFVLNVFLTISLFWFVGFIAVPLALSISAFWNLFLLLKEHKSSKLFILEKSQFLYLARYLFLALMIYLVISIIDLLGFGDHYLVGGIFTKGLLSFVLWLSFISIYDIEIRDLFIAYIKEKRYKT